MLRTIKTLFEGSLIRKFSAKFLFFGVVVYSLIRLVSLLTYASKTNEIIGVILIIIFAFICAKNLRYGWIILIGELLLDGAGHFFEFNDLILRTWFLGIFGLFWLCTKIEIYLSGNKILFLLPVDSQAGRLTTGSLSHTGPRQQKQNFISRKIPFPRHIFLSLIIFGIAVLWSTINGFQNNHALVNIAQDAILFCFLALFLPALEYRNFARKSFTQIIKVWIAGSAIFSLITFFIYSSGIGKLPDAYYHWFRNIAAGKITDLGNNFFRVVLPEHIFIVPIILILTAFLIRSSKNESPRDKIGGILWTILACSALVLTFNFTRIYFLGLAAGMLVLAFKNSFKRWLFVSVMIAGIFLLIFSSSFFIASRGKSFGLELLGVRIAGASAPAAETSGAIRLAILPDALKQIRQNPWFGNGLGAVVTYKDPATGESVTRTQFDWGYLEMLSELGIIGTVVFLIFYFQILWRIGRIAYNYKPQISAGLPAEVFSPTEALAKAGTKAGFVSPKSRLVGTKAGSLYQGIFAGGISLLIINITTPALFHGFGILYMVFMIVVAYGDDSGSAVES